MVNLRESLRAVMEQRGITQQDVARGTGLSGTVISQWLNERYAGDNAAVEAKIGVYLDVLSERDPESRHRLPFVRTSISNLIWSTARACHRDGVIGLATGPSGVGKSYAIEEYSRAQPGQVVVIESHKNYTTKQVISDLHRECGMSGDGSVHAMMHELTDRLRGSGRLIIVDEAEHLNAGTLDEVRRLNDWAGVGILYVGLERFRTMVVSLRRDYTYIANRVRLPIALKKLKRDDVLAILQAHAPQYAEHASAAHELCAGDGRRLQSMLYHVPRLAKSERLRDRPIDELMRLAAKELTI